MYKFKDLTGQAFGRLTVIDKSTKRTKDRNVIWICKCSCGAIKEIASNSVLRSKSCGCIKYETKNTKRPYEALHNILKLSATSRGLSIDIEYEDFLIYTRVGSCHYCYRPIQWSEFLTKKLDKRNCRYNLDRKDNSLGYLKSNVLVCCDRCNKGKSNLFTYEEWYKMTEPFRNGELQAEINEQGISEASGSAREQPREAS